MQLCSIFLSWMNDVIIQLMIRTVVNSNDKNGSNNDRSNGSNSNKTQQ